jgi:hypothetical protein
MFRVSKHPSLGVLKTVTAASGTGHNTGTATYLQRGLIGIPVWSLNGSMLYYVNEVFIYFKLKPNKLGL